MILPNGHFCLIREKFLTADGHLVLIVEHWPSEADYKSRPDQPRASHDHMWKLKSGHPPVTDQNDIGPFIHATLQMAIPPEGQGHHAVRTDHIRGTEDKHGWLAHPHVRSLEVVSQ
jgi:hypothetical protein